MSSLFSTDEEGSGEISNDQTVLCLVKLLKRLRDASESIFGIEFALLLRAELESVSAVWSTNKIG